MKLLEVLITWHQKCLGETMDLRLISGVLELSFIFFSVVSLPFGQVCFDPSCCIGLVFCSSMLIERSAAKQVCIFISK